MMQSSRMIAQRCCRQGILSRNYQRQWLSSMAVDQHDEPSAGVITDDVAELIDVRIDVPMPFLLLLRSVP